MTQILDDVRQRLCTTAALEGLRRPIFLLPTAIFVAIVGDTTWELILHIFALVRFHFMHLIEAQVFRPMFESRINRGEKSLHRGSLRTSHA